jgi:hypothetical protein
MLRATLHGGTEIESTVTINCRAIRFVRSHLPLLPLSIFFSATATAAVVVMVSFFVYSLPRTPTRGPCCRTTSAPTYNVHPDSRRGACLCPRGQCNQQCNEHPHRTNMLQIKGGGTLTLEGRHYRGNCCHCCCRRCHRCCCHCCHCCMSPSPSPSSLLQVAVIVTRTINFLQFLLCRMFFCNHKQVTVNNAYVHGQKVMGRANQRLGKLLVGSPKDLRFVGSLVYLQRSQRRLGRLADHSCLPPNPEFLHYLWGLAFLQTYPANNTALSTLLGGKDPKTVYKYVWLYIQSLFGLTKVLVR